MRQAWRTDVRTPRTQTNMSVVTEWQSRLLRRGPADVTTLRDQLRRPSITTVRSVCTCANQSHCDPGSYAMCVLRSRSQGRGALPFRCMCPQAGSCRGHSRVGRSPARGRNFRDIFLVQCFRSSVFVGTTQRPSRWSSEDLGETSCRRNVFVC